MSSDIDTNFADRGCQIQVHPFSFAEYCAALQPTDALWLVRDWCEATGDVRVEPFLARYFAFQRAEFATYPLAAESKWAVARAGDELEVVLWLYRRTGRLEWLDFARTISAQSAAG